jgi:hypothetical protein
MTTMYTVVATGRSDLDRDALEAKIRERLNGIDFNICPCGWAPDPDTIAEYTIDADEITVIDLS